MIKLAIITTHPIQYNAPWFRMLAERRNIGIKVFYTWSQSQTSVKDHNFGKEIAWDIPLLEGYEYEFVQNISKKPGSHHFFGIDCPSLISKINQFRADAVLVFGWNFKSHFQVMRHFKGKIPVWFRGDSTLLDELPGFKTILRRQILRFVYHYVDAAFYVGKANKAYFLKHGLKEKQLHYAPHAIDNERFRGTGNQFDTEAQQWRTRLGFSETDLIILFAGKLESKKQPDFLLKAVQMANVKRKIPVKLLFVGTGKMENHLKELAKDDVNIRFISFQNQSKMPIVYRLGNVLCLPSKGPGETWGLSVNEAMAAGVTVMATEKVGCVYDIITTNEIGFIVAHDNFEEIVALIETLNLKELKKMSILATEKINEWSFQKLVSNIEYALLNEIRD